MYLSEWWSQRGRENLHVLVHSPDGQAGLGWSRSLKLHLPWRCRDPGIGAILYLPRHIVSRELNPGLEPVSVLDAGIAGYTSSTVPAPSLRSGNTLIWAVISVSDHPAQVHLLSLLWKRSTLLMCVYCAHAFLYHFTMVLSIPCKSINFSRYKKKKSIYIYWLSLCNPLHHLEDKLTLTSQVGGGVRY